MPYSIEFQISSLFFILILNVVYFRKEKVKTAENKIYSVLLIFTPITIAFDILSVFSIGNSEYIPDLLVTISAKCYTTSMAVWVSLWCRYLVTLCFHHTHTEKEEKFYKYIKITVFIIDCIFVLAITILPIQYTGNGRHIYSYGLSTVTTYLYAFTNWFFSLVCFLFAIKRTPFFRILPVLSYIIIQGLAGILQFNNASLLLTSFAGSVTVMITFFTVENPDIGVIRALEKAQAKADEANKTKDSFLANMSHEMRTPLNAILGMNEMITREADNDAILEYSEQINESGKILLSLVNDVLDFSKIEAGKMEIIPSSYNLSALLNSIENMLLSKIENKGLNLDIIVEHSIPKHLIGDEMRLKQILLNILNNAFKYTEHGSITLRISSLSPVTTEPPANINISSLRLPDENENNSFSFIMLHFEVEDTGIGIKEENIATLFDAFNRIDEKQNRNIEGTGLGLSIANGFLNLMGSRINVKSEYGKGSTFSFDLVQQVTSSEPIGNYKLRYKNKIIHKSNNITTWSAPDAKILAVDDVRVNLAVVKGLLKKLKIQVDTALSGEEAIKKVCENNYDIILMDHMMPEMDGIETFNKLCEIWKSGNVTSVPVIALTANAVVGVKELFMEKGFSGYISKPIDSKELDNILRQFIPADKILT